KEVSDISRYGSMNIDSSLRVQGFLEQSSHSKRGWVSAGVYLIQKEVLSSFSLDVYSIEHDFFPKLLKTRIVAYPGQGLFVDIGTHDSYWQAQELLRPWIIP